MDKGKQKHAAARSRHPSEASAAQSEEDDDDGRLLSRNASILKRRKRSRTNSLDQGMFGTPTTFKMNQGNNDQDGSCQVFSTEFISAMHVDDSQDIGDAKIITDAWKQKYNDPIQVPSGASKLMFTSPRTAPREPFKCVSRIRPRQLVKCRVPVDDVTKLRYDADLQDSIWLSHLNNTRDPAEAMKVESLESIMIALEKEAHRGLTEQVRDPDNSIRDRVCDVCQLLDGEPDNEMVFCDGCNTLVHQKCYGIVSVPEGDWYCQACQAKRTKTKCELCPNHEEDGAFKKTDVVGRWAHVMCALWVPECRFGDPVLMEPILLRDIPIQRQKLQCSICKLKMGACIQCDEPTCTTAFHVTCALQQNLRMEINVTESGMVIRRAFCKRHQKVTPENQEGYTVVISGGARKRTSVEDSISTEFCDFVDVVEVAKFTKRPIEDCEDVFAYWAQKRRAAGGTPLIRELHFKVAEIKKGIRNNRFEPERKSLLALKHSLERARSLCSMAQDREAKKRGLLELMRAEFVISVNSYALSLNMDLSLLLNEDMNSDWFSSSSDSKSTEDGRATGLSKPARTPRRAALSAQEKITSQA